MSNGTTNGNGHALTRRQVESFVTWTVRGLLAVLMSMLIWNATQAINRLEELGRNYESLKDRTIKLEVQQEEIQRRMTEKDEQVEDLRTLLVSGQVRVVSPAQ